ncbi:hypothetical protein NUU61_007808 [Penicillium alfredii]|uniref:Aspartate aminotransferase n=1 Tax=Penicillium alfredii TaxID=1506179 RepID=A0A9W9ERG3_9EURO|nr:uncharacterized protein NUU61_007808 [Penicillium alfredii]KAJ5086501.1 hypothetical protein NUU61_007808 [Penicillium alfredii]
MGKQYLGLPIIPADTAFGLMADFDADTHPNKVSLIAGAYRDASGNPWILPSVRKAKEAIGESTLEVAEPNDVVILQTCAHNPTGVDLSNPQWMKILDLVQRKKLFVVFDSAYQGFATGDVNEDAWAVRLFTEEILASGSHPGLCVAQSFSKNFGLYGERVGALHLIVPRHLSAQGAQSELMAIARAEYSNPPRPGAVIVETILGDQRLKAQWETDLNTMSSRIKEMRHELRWKLEKETQQDWSYIENQIGMFSSTGLTSQQVSRLRDEFHVYLLPSGRLSVCGLTERNVQYVAHAICQVMNT